MHTLKRILVVCRMMRHCANAIRCGISLSRHYGAELYVLHVSDSPRNCGQGWNLSAPALILDNKYDTMLQKTRNELHAIVNCVGSTGAHVTELVRRGDPGEVIMQVVEEKDADLIIMSAHEEGRLERFLFNYSNEKIIRRIPCSILLVKTEPAVVGAEY